MNREPSAGEHQKLLKRPRKHCNTYLSLIFGKCTCTQLCSMVLHRPPYMPVCNSIAMNSTQATVPSRFSEDMLHGSRCISWLHENTIYPAPDSLTVQECWSDSS